MTVAAFMERALYDPDGGYYTGAGQRSGRDGDFYTSVDAGPLFGQLLAELIARVWARHREANFDLVEAGAGNGRLMGDVLDALRTSHAECHASLRVRLVERSAVARQAHDALAARHDPLPVHSSPDLPERFDGLLFANELLDAMPAHRLVQTDRGLREAYVREDAGRLALGLGPVSSPALASYVGEVGVELPAGATVDVSPAAVAWVGDAARRLGRGAMLLIDYGHEARTLFAGHLLGGTLASYARHRLDPSRARENSPRHPAWLEEPGQRDLTAHVDFTSVARAAEREGARREWLVDQTRLLLGLGLAGRFATASGSGVADVRWRLAAKTLVGPQGLGESHKALLLTKGLHGAGLLDAF